MKPTQIEQAIVEQVERYRFVLPDSIVAEPSTETTSEVVRRLIQRRVLHEVRLPAETVCLAARRSPATTQSVARALAVHSFCRDPSRRQTFLRKTELARYFPTLFQTGLPGGYYVDATRESPVLGLIRVDVGLDEVGRIVSRCHQLARRHQQLPGFRQLMTAGQFEITYLVATEQKARRLSVALSLLEKTGVRCVVEPVPILLDLLAPLPTT